MYKPFGQITFEKLTTHYAEDSLNLRKGLAN